VRAGAQSQKGDVIAQRREGAEAGDFSEGIESLNQARAEAKMPICERGNCWLCRLCRR